MSGYVIDKQVEDLLQEAGVAELTANMQSAYSEKETDDTRTDMEILKDELDYLLEMYAEKGTYQNDEYTHAKKLIEETQNGKVMSLDIETFKPKIPMSEIERARDIIGEVERLKKLEKKMRGKK